MHKYIFVVLCSAIFLSCGQIVNSIVEESAKDVDQRNNEEFEEMTFMADTFSVIDTKVKGNDTLTLVRTYYMDGKAFFESWQDHGTAQGITTFFYPSGKVRYSLLYVDGYPNTLMSCFDAKGRQIDGGNLKAGNGSLIVYHPFTGHTMYNMTYRNGLRHGAYSAYFSDCKKGQEANFANDTLIGPYVKYYWSGKVHTKGNMDMRSTTGVLDIFYANGNIRKREEYRNGKQYAYMEYDVNGTLTEERKTIHGELTGTKYFYGSEDQLLSREQTLDGKRHGTSEYFYANGAKKSKETYRNDTLQSDTIWFQNGKLSAISSYKNGSKTGICKEYYPTGVLRVEQMFVNGVEEGMYKSYFANGRIYNEGQFKNGELSGDLEFYSEQGKHTHTKHYN